VEDEEKDQWGPSRVVITRDGFTDDPGEVVVQVREVQLPWEDALNLHGPHGSIVVMDVGELLDDIERLRDMVVSIARTYRTIPKRPQVAGQESWKHYRVRSEYDTRTG